MHPHDSGHLHAQPHAHSPLRSGTRVQVSSITCSGFSASVSPVLLQMNAVRGCDPSGGRRACLHELQSEPEYSAARGKHVAVM